MVFFFGNSDYERPSCEQFASYVAFVEEGEEIFGPCNLVFEKTGLYLFSKRNISATYLGISPHPNAMKMLRSERFYEDDLKMIDLLMRQTLGIRYKYFLQKQNMGWRDKNEKRVDYR